jgi:hypothetical protein
MQGPVAASTGIATPSATGNQWLAEINTYRLAAGLNPVVEEPSWSAALMKHLKYMIYSPPQYAVGQYASAHTENPASPYYTPEGDQAGRSSNLAWGYGGTPVDAIDIWLTGPFHSIGILRPQLTKVAFAQYPGSTYVGLNVISGYDSSVPTPSNPTLFPGPGITTDLTQFTNGEVPDPEETCGWSQAGPQRGLALIAMLPNTPVVGLTATLVGESGPDFTTANGSLCVIDENTYHSSDPVYGEDGGLILQGDHAVLLMANAPLTYGRYDVVIKQPTRPDIAWSFVEVPKGKLAGGKAMTLHVTNTGAKTVMGNLTVTQPSGSGFTTVYPCNQGRPTASNNNFVAGQTIPNFVAAHPDSNGDICIYTSSASHVIWDQVAETNAFTAHNPTRLLDTRAGTKPAAGQAVTVHVTDPGVAATVMGNLTVTDPAAAGFTTVYPCTDGRPTASNNNFAKGQTIPNFVAAHPDANGDICIYTSVSAQLIWDQVAETSAFAAQNATRLLDTRTGAKPAKGAVVTVHVTDSGATTVMGNLTVTAPTDAGFTTVYPCLDGRPTASNNNFVAGQTIPNFVAAHPDSAGNICIYTSASAHLIWDQVAETAAFAAHTATRIYDTRTPQGYLLP